MKKEILSLLTALLSAFAATVCCLPPLLFVLFGISFGFLSFLEVLTPFRIPLSLLSLFVLWLSWRSYAHHTFTCNPQKKKRYVWFYSIVLGLIIAILLYPEWANLLIGNDE